MGAGQELGSSSSHALEDLDALRHRDRERISQKLRVEDLFGRRLGVGAVPGNIGVDSKLVLAHGDEHGRFFLVFCECRLAG